MTSYKLPFETFATDDGVKAQFRTTQDTPAAVDFWLKQFETTAQMFEDFLEPYEYVDRDQYAAHFHSGDDTDYAGFEDDVKYSTDMTLVMLDLYRSELKVARCKFTLALNGVWGGGPYWTIALLYHRLTKGIERLHAMARSEGCPGGLPDMEDLGVLGEE